MDEVAEYRARKMSERYDKLNNEYRLAGSALLKAKDAHEHDNTEESRQKVLIALRSSIELLEQLRSIELYMQNLYKSDRDWQAQVEQRASTTDFQLGVLYASNFGPTSPYGFNMTDL